MKCKVYKGKTYGVQLSKKENKALKDEIYRQLIEIDKQHSKDIDVLVLWTLHKYFGFGAGRLKRFFNALAKEHSELLDHYEMPDDIPWLCDQKLKEVGVDIDEWYKEVEA